MAQTHFINVDLEVRAATDLTALASAFEAFEPGAMALSCMPIDDGFLANLELHEEPDDAETGILGFLRLIDALPPEARRLWDDARQRDFSIGVRAGSTPSPFELVITPATLDRVAKVGARISLAVYPPDDE